MNDAILFQKATKAQAKARIALSGPTGSGKTHTSLTVAVDLAGGSQVVLVDTERGSGALYADQFDYGYHRFDPPYDPRLLVDVLKAAEAHVGPGGVVIVDSMSHFWEGEGGTLDIVDAAAQRAHGNKYAGWNVGTPALRRLVDTMLGLDCHLIVTMRSKMAYVLDVDDRTGRQIPRKVGMAPVMRDGVEYEFTLVGDMDLEHRIMVTKSRCSALADQVVQPGNAVDLARTFKAWLESGEPVVSAAQAAEIADALNSIADQHDRTVAKRAFVASYDMPERVLARQFTDALTFARELAGAGSSRPGIPGDTPPAPPSPQAAPEAPTTTSPAARRRRPAPPAEEPQP